MTSLASVILGIMSKKCWSFLSRAQMQIPSKVSLAMTLRQTSVLSVPVFQSSEVSFERIGRFGNERGVKITEHVRQGRQKHAAGSLEIAEDPALLR